MFKLFKNFTKKDYLLILICLDGRKTSAIF